MSEPRRAIDPNSLPARRSQGQIVVARALWYVKPGEAAFRTERLAPLGPGEVRVKTEYSGISRGTERLVALGAIPKSEWSSMRAPSQAGEFSFPLKYGYSAVGIVTAGDAEFLGQCVFALHPHQDHFQLPQDELVPLDDAVTSRRAVLAANMETALNAHWDAGVAPGDRVLVVGAGVLGLLIAYLASRMPGTDVAITDINPQRASIAVALGLRFAGPRDIPTDNRVVFHTSATGPGLETAINAAAFEGRVVELSWYGTQPVTANLGGAFHSRRLSIISSQVGHVAPSQRSQVTRRERLKRAVALLADPALDALVTGEVAFADLPSALPRIWSSTGLPPVVRY